jgi:hypothetical protein
MSARSAREELFEALFVDFQIRSRDQVNALLDAYAHELAEKIRQHWYPRFPGKSEYTRGVDDGYDKAANLIDPEVSS